MRALRLTIALLILAVVPAGIEPARAQDRDGKACAAGGDAAIVACTSVIERDSGMTSQARSVVYRRRGGAYLDKGDLDRAIADYDQAIVLDPAHADAYNGRGRAYWTKGDKDKALPDYERAIQINPRHAAAYNNRGLVRAAKGEASRAVDDYDEAIRIEPRHRFAHNNRGNVYAAKGDHDRAIADFSEAIRITPANGDIFNNRGRSFWSKGDKDRAIADFNEAIRLNPNHASAYNNRGLVHAATGEMSQAIADYDTAIRINPRHLSAYGNRGFVYASKGQTARAIADFDEAIRIDARNTSAYVNRGSARTTVGDSRGALADFDQAIRIAPRLAKAYRGRSIAHTAAGEPELALRDLETYVGLNPQDRDAQAQLAPLRAIAADKLARAMSAPASLVLTKPPAPAAPAPQRRVALVIGNAQYQAQARLVNPLNDAGDVGAALAGLGFKVTKLENASYDAMRTGLRAFAAAAEQADMAVVFFAGHGIEMGGENYLIPVDASLRADRDVAFEAMPLTQVLSAVDSARLLGLIILDACRNDPFRAQMVASAGAKRSTNNGLARIEPTGNVLVAYAAREGTVAADGAARNSPFTQALLKHIRTLDIDVSFVFRRVRDEVRQATGNKQSPAMYGSLSGDVVSLAVSAAVTVKSSQPTLP